MISSQHMRKLNFLHNSTMENIDKFQELTRILDATLWEVNPSGGPSGQNALNLVKYLLDFPGMSEYLPANFAEFAKSEIESAGQKSNVRAQIKNIWMFPKFAYEPWTRLDIPDKLLGEVHDIMTTPYKLKIVDSKVYAASCGRPDIINKAYAKLKEYMEPNVVPNIEVNHITIVNSNIVHDCGEDKVRKFVKRFKKDNHFARNMRFAYGNIKSTTSKDWARFSKCYVIEVDSADLWQFVTNFNAEFGTKINPSFHITFSILPRSLFSAQV